MTVNPGNGVPLSVNVSVIVADPFLLRPEVITALQFGAVPAITIFALGINAVSEEVPTTLALQFKDESISVIVKLIALLATSSSADFAVITEIIGASFTALTERLKTELAVITGAGTPVSAIVNVIFAVPFLLPAGVIVAVQFGEVPAITILALGTSDVSLEVPVTSLHATAASGSAIVKAIPLIIVSSFVILFVMAEIVGA